MDREDSRSSSASKWDAVLALVTKKQYLEAYKLIISDPDEHCLLRLIGLTGPVVHALDAESRRCCAAMPWLP